MKIYFNKHYISFIFLYTVHGYTISILTKSIDLLIDRIDKHTPSSRGTRIDTHIKTLGTDSIAKFQYTVMSAGIDILHAYEVCLCVGLIYFVFVVGPYQGYRVIYDVYMGYMVCFIVRLLLVIMGSCWGLLPIRIFKAKSLGILSCMIILSICSLILS